MDKVVINTIISIVNKVVEDAYLTSEEIKLEFEVFGVDSISFMNIVVLLEKEFKCEIPDSKLLLSEMNTVEKIYNVLNEIQHL